MMDFLLTKPTGGWALRRGLLVHGAADPVELIEALADFTLAGRAEKIRCPTWVCNAEGDDISASAPELVEALTCEKEFVTFTAAEGAGDHCEGGARALYHARSFGGSTPCSTRRPSRRATRTTGVPRASGAGQVVARLL